MICQDLFPDCMERHFGFPGEKRCLCWCHREKSCSLKESKKLVTIRITCCFPESFLHHHTDAHLVSSHLMLYRIFRPDQWTQYLHLWHLIPSTFSTVAQDSSSVYGSVNLGSQQVFRHCFWSLPHFLFKCLWQESIHPQNHLFLLPIYCWNIAVLKEFTLLQKLYTNSTIHWFETFWDWVVNSDQKCLPELISTILRLLSGHSKITVNFICGQNL